MKHYRTLELPTHTPKQFAAAVRQAADLLRAGEVVALPTETVYGLAANALNPAAVARIFAVKGRPSHNPIIVHVASLAMAKRCVAAWNAQAERLARAFWPGPLTLVLPRAAAIPHIVTADGPTVGVRWPNHPFMQAVIRACGFPLAAPSANLSNRISPTTAAHVRQQLSGRIPLIVDGGPSPVGIESTVVDLTVRPFAVLRPGMIHAASLAAALGRLRSPLSPTGGEGRSAGAFGTAKQPAKSRRSQPAGPILRSPGQLRRHYSPEARLLLLTWKNDADLLAQLRQHGCTARQTWILAHTQVPSDQGFMGASLLPHEAGAYARSLYAELHRCDAEKPEAIVVEAPPAGPEWQGIADRLKRAAATL